MKVPETVAPDGIATSEALRSCGVSKSMLAKRCRPGGPWRRLLPGVIMLDRGEPTRRQLLRAAVAYAGPNAVITGADALRARGMDVPLPRTVRMLIPTEQRLASKEFVTAERTTRVPRPYLHRSLPFAPPDRAAVDIARTTSDIARLRLALAMPVLHGWCDHDALRREVDAGNQRGTAAVRMALRQLDASAAGVLHANAARLIHDEPLPPPRWNVTVYDRQQRPMGYADAWWDEVGLAWQFGPPTPDAPAPTHGHLALTAAGVVVVRTAAHDIRRATADPRERGPIMNELLSAYAQASGLPAPRVDARCLTLPSTA